MMKTQKTHKLYWQPYHATMLARENKNSDYTYDGTSRDLPLEMVKESLYGEVKLEPYDSILSRSKILCTITPKHLLSNPALERLGSERLDCARTLILDQTDDPLSQVLRYLNKHKDNDAYKLDVEYRVRPEQDFRYGAQAEFVSLAGSWPGELQWMYHGASDYYELWTPEEQLPLENLMHTHAENWFNNYWELSKRPEGLTAYRYYASRYSWQSGWYGANTPEELVQEFERKEYSRK
jgi:hypothetical protein